MKRIKLYQEIYHYVASNSRPEIRTEAIVKFIGNNYRRRQHKKPTGFMVQGLNLQQIISKLIKIEGAQAVYDELRKQVTVEVKPLHVLDNMAMCRCVHPISIQVTKPIKPLVKSMP